LSFRNRHHPLRRRPINRHTRIERRNPVQRNDRKTAIRRRVIDADAFQPRKRHTADVPFRLFAIGNEHHLIVRDYRRMIEPFEPGQIRAADGKKIISYGTSSYGYDIRCAPEFKVFTNIHSTVVDPKNFDEKSFVDFNEDVCIIPPNSFALARTVEYFRIPRSVLTICLGKSTYARCGIIVNVTPFEPEWEGHVTIEISNTTPLPAKIYANEGIAQVLFFQSDEPCEISYKDKRGKYQAQRGVTLPKI